jgi:hypothetical protein
LVWLNFKRIFILKLLVSKFMIAPTHSVPCLWAPPNHLVQVLGTWLWTLHAPTHPVQTSSVALNQTVLLFLAWATTLVWFLLYTDSFGADLELLTESAGAPVFFAVLAFTIHRLIQCLVHGFHQNSRCLYVCCVLPISIHRPIRCTSLDTTKSVSAKGLVQFGVFVLAVLQVCFCYIACVFVHCS